MRPIHPFFQNGAWQAISDPASEFYDPTIKAFLVGGISFDVLSAVFWFVALFLFFVKHRFFPRLFIALLLIPLVILPLDAWLYTFIDPTARVFNPKQWRDGYGDDCCGDLGALHALIKKG